MLNTYISRLGKDPVFASGADTIQHWGWKMRWTLLCVTATILGALVSSAQQPQTVVQSRFIYIPAFVENKEGKAIYDLSSEAFSVEDNGIARPTVVAGDFNLKPVALVVVIRTGRYAGYELHAIRGLGGLLNAIVTQPQDRTAIITYDQDAHLVQEFTSESDASDTTLSELRPGNAGASLYDALNLALTTMKSVSDDEQKIILMIGGARDHGSNLSDPVPVLQEVASQNIAVYSLAFPPPRKGLTGDLHILNPFGGLAVGNNAAQSLAQLTGGDFYEFRNAKSFEDRMLELASHIHSRYVLRMDTSGVAPGFHTLRVQVKVSGDHRVIAKSGYFVPVKPQHQESLQ